MYETNTSKKLKPNAKSHTNVKPTHPKLSAIKTTYFLPQINIFFNMFFPSFFQSMNSQRSLSDKMVGICKKITKSKG